jgi:hypothetical protein
VVVLGVRMIVAVVVLGVRMIVIAHEGLSADCGRGNDAGFGRASRIGGPGSERVDAEPKSEDAEPRFVRPFIAGPPALTTLQSCLDIEGLAHDHGISLQSCL